MDKRRLAAEFFAAARNGRFRPAWDHTSCGVARGLVFFPNWLQSGQASHLRFSGAESKIAHARIEFRERDGAGAHSAAGQIPDSTGPTRHRRGSEERIVL